MLGDTKKAAKKIDSAFEDLNNEIHEIEQNNKSKVLQFPKAN